MKNKINVIKLTNEILEDLKTENFIAIAMAEGGAMGDPGSIIIVDEELKYYRTHFGEVDNKTLEDKIPFLKTINIRLDGVTGFGEDWDYLYTGFGNHLFVRPKYKDPILRYVDEKCANDNKNIPKVAHIYTNWYDALKEFVGAKNG